MIRTRNDTENYKHVPSGKCDTGKDGLLIGSAKLVLAFILLFVSFMPLPMTSPLCTNTHPTGVSSLDSASSAWPYGQLSTLQKDVAKGSPS